MMKTNKIQEGLVTNNYDDWKEVNIMCIALNYHLYRYTNTKSKRFKEKHMKNLLYMYYKLDHWLKKHSNYTMDYAQRGIIVNVKYEVRNHFNRRLVDEN